MLVERLMVLRECCESVLRSHSSHSTFYFSSEEYQDDLT
ncbi:hypothetical protein AM1_4405 [Acaryochloris marina MBIC11017]|uniref:Uncharacterized protein n=2 Tax=Acaryochloris marina TaxID=155978 RepID=B0CEY7_ACAM1|nr:hypothetical protein AM1_4405 [Acaryochloris marina MBIC11017]